MTQNTPGNDKSSLLSLNHRKCVIAHAAKKHLARVASTLAQFIAIHPPTAKWQKKWQKNTFHHHTPITPDTTPKANTVINYNRRKSVQYNTWMCVQGTWTSVPQMKSYKETIICLIIHNITHKIKAYLEEIEAFQTSSKLCPEQGRIWVLLVHDRLMLHFKHLFTENASVYLQRQDCWINELCSKGTWAPLRRSFS